MEPVKKIKHTCDKFFVEKRICDYFWWHFSPATYISPPWWKMLKSDSVINAKHHRSFWELSQNVRDCTCTNLKWLQTEMVCRSTVFPGVTVVNERANTLCVRDHFVVLRKGLIACGATCALHALPCRSRAGKADSFARVHYGTTSKSTFFERWKGKVFLPLRVNAVHLFIFLWPQFHISNNWFTYMYGVGSPSVRINRCATF